MVPAKSKNEQDIFRPIRRCCQIIVGCSAASFVSQVLKFNWTLGYLFFCISIWADPLVAQGDGALTVFSKSSNGYSRPRLPDGSYEFETFTLLKGGLLSSDVADPTIDKVSFDEIGRTVAEALARQKYVPSRDHDKIKLLIVVYWGTTKGVSSSKTPLPSIAQDVQEAPDLLSGDLQRLGAQSDIHNIVEAANMLGYTSKKDIAEDLDKARYFIVLLAYDFQAKLKNQKSILLWETRFSVPERGNAFDEQLPSIVRNASLYFGQDTRSLVRPAIREGQVILGETRSLGAMPELDLGSASLAPDGAHVAYIQEENQRWRLIIACIDRSERPAMVEMDRSYRDVPGVDWADARHVLVSPKTSKAIIFNLVGDRSEPTNAIAGRVPSAAYRPGADDPAYKQLYSLINQKLPDRQVAVMEADQVKHRFLLLVSGGGGPDRYFVYDHTDDLLYEIGPRRLP
jgi:hypothetical protein